MGANTVSYDPVRERAQSIVNRALARRTVVDELVSRVQTYGVPVAVVGYGILQLWRRLKSRKPKQTASSTAAAASSATKAAEKQAERQRKIRRDYKVRRSGEGDFGLMAGFHGADDFPTDIDPGDHVLEGYNEGEVEAAGEAGGEGGPPNQMLQMLQSMGFRVVMPKDGSGQVFLVPPGAEGPSEEEMSGPGGQIMTGGRFQINEGVPEGDEEGEDGDEDGGEGGRYLDDGEEDEYDEDEEDGEEYEEA